MVDGCLGTLGTRGSPLRREVGKPFLVVMAGWEVSLATAALWRAALLLAAEGRPRCLPRPAVCCSSLLVCSVAPSTENIKRLKIGKIGSKNLAGDFLLTWFWIKGKRGKEGICTLGQLPTYKGTKKFWVMFCFVLLLLLLLRCYFTSVDDSDVLSKGRRSRD
jgi:hypothetical protein